MLNNYSHQTTEAFRRIEDALAGRTDDDLCCLKEELGSLYKRAQDIHNMRASLIDGSDYQIPHRY
jgi:hypothetical protein